MCPDLGELLMQDGGTQVGRHDHLRKQLVSKPLFKLEKAFGKSTNAAYNHSGDEKRMCAQTGQR